MCQKSLDACIIFYYNYLFSLLGSSPSFTFIEKKKRERENGIYTVHVILNTDFALLNHRQITLPKYLEQITQEFLFLPS